MANAHRISFELFGAVSVRYNRQLWAECIITFDLNNQNRYFCKHESVANASRSMVDHLRWDSASCCRKLQGC